MTEIPLATHSYDYKKFYFDVNCNHELKQKRLEGMAKNLEEVNAEVLSKNKQIDLSEICDQVIYDVKYLEEDNNTGLYDEIKEWMYTMQLRALAKEQFKILEMTVIEIKDELLYQGEVCKNPSARKIPKTPDLSVQVVVKQWSQGLL